jgi:RNA polymerase sigma-70 factor (ECF subfamily)
VRCPLRTRARIIEHEEATALNRHTVEAPAHDGPSAGDLLARTAPGDRLAFQLLHRRYEAYAFWLARRILASPADAEDAVQDAWVKVFTRAHAALPTGRARAWLRTVVVRCCLDHKRRARREPAATELRGDLAGPSGSTVARMDLERALSCLEEDLRHVVVLHDIEGLAHGEVADLLNISAEASRSRLCRARRRLRESLERP